MKITVISALNENNEFLKEMDTYINDSDMVITKIDLNKYNLKYCVACDYCQNKNPGVCCNNDGMNEIYKQYLSSNKVIVISPVEFGCFNSQTKKFIDRAQPLALPLQMYKNKKTMMKPRYDKYPDIICIGVTDSINKKEVEIFESFAMNCSLFEFSKSVSAEVVSNINDLSFLKNLMKGQVN